MLLTNPNNLTAQLRKKIDPIKSHFDSMTTEENNGGGSCRPLCFVNLIVWFYNPNNRFFFASNSGLYSFKTAVQQSHRDISAWTHN